MQQLGEFRQHAQTFADLDAEIIVVFREDQDEAASLRAIREQTELPATGFHLLSDLGAEETAAYSRGEQSYPTYIVDDQGVIRAILAGDTRERPGPAAVIEQLHALAQ